MMCYLVSMMKVYMNVYDSLMSPCFVVSNPVLLACADVCTWPLLSPHAVQVVDMLHRLYSQFDSLIHDIDAALFKVCVGGSAYSNNNMYSYCICTASVTTGSRMGQEALISPIRP